MRSGVTSFCFVWLLCIVPTAMADTADGWRVLLEQQLLADEKCDLNYLTDLVPRQEDLGVDVKARAHCQDGRSFDVHKRPGAQKFQITACKPTYC